MRLEPSFLSLPRLWRLASRYLLPGAISCTDQSCRTSDNDCVVGHVLRDHSPRSDERISADGHSAYHRRVGTYGGTRLPKGRNGLPVANRLWDTVVGEDHMGSDEDLVLDRHS